MITMIISSIVRIWPRNDTKFLSKSYIDEVIELIESFINIKAGFTVGYVNENAIDFTRASDINVLTDYTNVYISPTREEEFK